jgi:predicted glutamine amidotransferase
MCGIVGFVSFNLKDRKGKKAFLWDGLYLNALRGIDATGIAIVDKPNDSPVVYKKALSSWDFLQLDRTNKMLDSAVDGTCVLGHTRSATRGSNTDDNAHPFKHGHITLIHNGAVFNAWDISDKQRFQVDSEAMCYALSANEDTKALLERVNGDYCFIWHDSKKGTFNIVRNKGRPLYWAYIPEWDGMAYASEMGMLASILSRNGINIKDKYFFPDEHVWFEWKLEDKSITGYKTTPFVPAPIKSTPVAVIGAGRKELTVPTDRGTIKSDTGLFQKLFAARAQFSKLAEQAKVRSAKQIAKAGKRLKAHNMDPKVTYTISKPVYLPYMANAVAGFLVCKRITNNGAELPVIIHNVIEAEWKEMMALMKEGDAFFYKPVDTYGGITGIPVCIIAEIDDPLVYERNPRGPIECTYLPGPGGEYIPFPEWRKLTEDGCQLCGGNCNPNHADDMVWEGEGNKEPICHVCVEQEVEAALRRVN